MIRPSHWLTDLVYQENHPFPFSAFIRGYSDENVFWAYDDQKKKASLISNGNQKLE